MTYATRWKKQERGHEIDQIQERSAGFCAIVTGPSIGGEPTKK
jgi:hypothetical protein